MNIIIFTQDDPFYVKKFFDEFFHIYTSKKNIKAVVISKAMGQKTKYKLAKQMLDFYGLYHFFIIGFKYALYKILSTKICTKMILKLSKKTFSIKQICYRNGIEVIERSDINSFEFINVIKKYEGDLFISIASPIIWKEKLIDTPKIDCINIHNGPLPFYKGMMPNFWQLYNNEKKSGITVHKINTGIDTGDIIYQKYIDIRENETLHELIIKTKKENAHMIKEVIHKYETNNVTYHKMEGDGSYFSFPTRQDVIQFKKNNKKVM